VTEAKVSASLARTGSLIKSALELSQSGHSVGDILQARQDRRILGVIANALQLVWRQVWLSYFLPAAILRSRAAFSFATSDVF
jgi:hypothetical protein